MGPSGCIYRNYHKGSCGGEGRGKKDDAQRTFRDQHRTDGRAYGLRSYVDDIDHAGELFIWIIVRNE